MCKIVLWGIGERTEYYMKLNYFSNCIIASRKDDNNECRTKI